MPALRVPAGQVNDPPFKQHDQFWQETQAVCGWCLPSAFLFWRQRDPPRQLQPEAVSSEQIIPFSF